MRVWVCGCVGGCVDVGIVVLITSINFLDTNFHNTGDLLKTYNLSGTQCKVDCCVYLCMQCHYLLCMTP